MNESIPFVTLSGKHKENILSSLINKGSLLCNEMLKSTIHSTKERLKEKPDRYVFVRLATELNYFKSFSYNKTL